MPASTSLASDRSSGSSRVSAVSKSKNRFWRVSLKIVGVRAARFKQFENCLISPNLIGLCVPASRAHNSSHLYLIP